MRGVLSLEFLGNQSPLSDERASTVFFALQMNGSASQWSGWRKTQPSRLANQKGERGEVAIKWIRMLGGDLPAFLRVLRPRLPRLQIWRINLKAGEIQRLGGSSAPRLVFSISTFIATADVLKSYEVDFPEDTI